jgi:hypothetical protein
MTRAVDQAKLAEFMGQMVSYMTGGAIWFGGDGDELGFIRVLTETGPATADEVVEKAGCNAHPGRRIGLWPRLPIRGRPQAAIDPWPHRQPHRTHTALGGNPAISRINNAPGQRT